MLSGKQFGVRKKPAIAADRIVDRQAVTASDDIVFLAMPGRGMHGAGARLRGDVLAEDDRHLALVERMREFQPFQIAPLAIGQHLGISPH